MNHGTHAGSGYFKLGSVVVVSCQCVPINRKLLEIPPEVVRRFAADMEAYHAEQDDIQRDRIAVGTRHMLLGQMPVDTKLRLSEVRELLELMR
ncbi:hypothetical protein GPL21_35730 [Bradyrhizobium pachyrhizi]|uniref:Uncharacterized protein n=1 Tax=Bradyrhizobium pachyrhizi TaxID=280333 RepID=A0A844STX4_9BRAD|nr:hypothetical protein [Bradyrhizobium pachyrhizi]MVT70428.1 hypothetical protein [Bradyrhizobium pachyrhizi]WFU55110.1 hypothetical protein QA639_37080 [Bradyrhizobium pachyrhizi]